MISSIGRSIVYSYDVLQWCFAKRLKKRQRDEFRAKRVDVRLLFEKDLVKGIKDLGFLPKFEVQHTELLKHKLRDTSLSDLHADIGNRYDVDPEHIALYVLYPCFPPTGRRQQSYGEDFNSRVRFMKVPMKEDMCLEKMISDATGNGLFDPMNPSITVFVALPNEYDYRNLRLTECEKPPRALRTEWDDTVDNCMLVKYFCQQNKAIVTLGIFFWRTDKLWAKKFLEWARDRVEKCDHFHPESGTCAPLDDLEEAFTSVENWSMYMEAIAKRNVCEKKPLPVTVDDLHSEWIRVNAQTMQIFVLERRQTPEYEEEEHNVDRILATIHETDDEKKQKISPARRQEFERRVYKHWESAGTVKEFGEQLVRRQSFKAQFLPWQTKLGEVKRENAHLATENTFPAIEISVDSRWRMTYVLHYAAREASRKKLCQSRDLK